MQNQNQRVYLTAISISGGIITLITEDGDIACYRQRGINSIADKKKRILIGLGLLAQDWQLYNELPKNWSISFEAPEIMGRARVTYPDADKLIFAATGRHIDKKTSHRKISGTKTKPKG